VTVVALVLATGASGAGAVVPTGTLLIPESEGGFLVASAAGPTSTYLLMYPRDPPVGACRLTSVDTASLSVRWTIDVRTELGCDAVTADETGVAVVGMQRQPDGIHVDIVVTKLDADGNDLWARRFGTAGDDLVGAAAMTGGVLYVTGTTYDGGGGSHSFVLRFDPEGNLDPAILDGSSSTGFGQVAADADALYVSADDGGGGGGQEIRMYERNGDPGWTLPLGGRSITFLTVTALSVRGARLIVGGYLDGHLPGERDRGPSDAFVLSVDRASGAIVWGRQFGSQVVDEVFDVAVDGTGVYVVGATYGALPRSQNRGGRDAFIRAYDLDGDVRWTRQFGTRRYDDAVGVETDGTSVTASGNSLGSIGGVPSAGGTTIYVRQFPAA
jgi:hypothetical protein